MAQAENQRKDLGRARRLLFEMMATLLEEAVEQTARGDLKAAGELAADAVHVGKAAEIIMRPPTP